jgi:hypothetical protein
MRRVSKLTLLLASAVLGGCYATPPLDVPRTPANRLQRVFAADFSTSGVANRIHGIERVFGFLAEEPARTERIAPHLRTFAANEPARIADLPALASSLVTTELARTPTGADFAVLMPGRTPDVPREIEQTARRVLMPEAFLGEIHDDRHRTDPGDDVPEASLWARLRRRLWL